MNEDNKIVHLNDYIATHRLVETIPDRLKTEFSKVPRAHLVKRGIAFGVDLLAIGVLKIVIDSGYAIFVSQFLAPVSSGLKSQLISTDIFFQASIFILIYCSYFLYSAYVFNGKTLGKMTMKLTVVNEDFVYNHKENTHSIDFNQSLKRSLGYLLCYISMGTFFIFNFSSEDKRGLPDYLSGSRTVSDDWLAQILDFKTHKLEEVRIDVSSLDKVS
jgi:uncharacterized RDD family membrane protein YckC